MKNIFFYVFVSIVWTPAVFVMLLKKVITVDTHYLLQKVTKLVPELSFNESNYLLW